MKTTIRHNPGIFWHQIRWLNKFEAKDLLPQLAAGDDGDKNAGELLPGQGRHSGRVDDRTEAEAPGGRQEQCGGRIGADRCRQEESDGRLG